MLGSERLSKIVTSRRLTLSCTLMFHVPATTSIATALLDSEPVFPTCTPLPITEAYDNTLQLQSTCSAARSKDAFHETAPLLSTSGTMGQRHRDESSQTEHCATREKDRKRRRFVGKANDPKLVSRASRWIGPRRNHNVRDLRKFQNRVPRLPCFDSPKIVAPPSTVKFPTEGLSDFGLLYFTLVADGAVPSGHLTHFGNSGPACRCATIESIIINH